MKKTHSNPKQIHHHQQNVNQKYSFPSKNKTTSTITHIDIEGQHTTKKNSLNKVASCTKIVNIDPIRKHDKPQLLNTSSKNSKALPPHIQAPTIYQKNEQLQKQNKILRDQFYKIQQQHLKDKTKIQQLITRMTLIKYQQYNDNTQRKKKQDNQEFRWECQCKNKGCVEKRKGLEIQLHRERIKVYELEQEKKKWGKTREQLKQQYRELLQQINTLRSNQ